MGSGLSIRAEHMDTVAVRAVGTHQTYLLIKHGWQVWYDLPLIALNAVSLTCAMLVTPNHVDVLVVIIHLYFAEEGKEGLVQTGLGG